MSLWISRNGHAIKVSRFEAWKHGYPRILLISGARLGWRPFGRTLRILFVDPWRI